MERCELLYKIAKELELNDDEYHMLIHDINNLRADEWWDEVYNSCSRSLIIEFYKIMKEG